MASDIRKKPRPSVAPDAAKSENLQDNPNRLKSNITTSAQVRDKRETGRP